MDASPTHETLPGDGRPHPGDPGPQYGFFDRVMMAADHPSERLSPAPAPQPAAAEFMPVPQDGAIFLSVGCAKRIANEARALRWRRGGP